MILPTCLENKTKPNKQKRRRWQAFQVLMKYGSIKRGNTQDTNSLGAQKSLVAKQIKNS